MALTSGNVQQSAVAEHATNDRLPPPLPPKMCPGDVAHQDRTPQNEQGWRPTTSGLQSPNPPSAPALLRTSCCLHTIQHFLYIYLFIYLFIHLYLFFLIFPLIILYTYHVLHSPPPPNSVHARMRIITHHLPAAPPSSPPEVVPFSRLFARIKSPCLVL